ncbi:MAG: Mini-ribonuclease 3 [Clostridia bacterium]|nr:Mini-ribonuclease 3 [Clostridia bacterium]
MIGKEMTPMQARQENPLALAFVGDTVFDLYVRTRVLEREVNSHKLHMLSVKHVSASAQAAAFLRIEPLLNEDEIYIYRRGRNTKPTTVPKNACVKDYRSATGLETLVGYLYLTGQRERLDLLMGVILQTHQNDDKE